MASKKPKGLIISKIIIVLLSVALIATILYPKYVWEKQEKDTQLSRENMMHLHRAQLIYLFEKGVYTDSIDELINFIKNDSTERLIYAFLKADSIFSNRLFKELSQTSDTAKAVVDSIKKWGVETGIDTTEQWIIDSLSVYPRFRKYFREKTHELLTRIPNCPTTGKPYKVTVIDTSVIKVVNIESPIDSSDIEAVKKDFKLHFLGGYALENHGKLENGEPSWTKK